MLNYFLVSLGIVSYVLGVSLPKALEADSYAVPTVVTEEALSDVPSSAPMETPTEQNPQLTWQVMQNVRSAFLPPRKIDEDLGPNDIAARGALIMDVSTKRVLWQKNPDVQMPIASITKLMTALVYLDHQPEGGLQHVHTLATEDNTPGGKELNLPEGEKLTTFDLLRSSIVGSDNDTAMALAHSTGYSNQVFVGLMNEKARMLGMKHSSFTEQTGLSAKDISTPHDIALLAAEAFSQPDIAEPARMVQHQQETVDTHHFSRVYTTDQLLYDKDLTITGGKTGYTEEAGYCFVVQAQVSGTDRQVIAVVLGTATEQARFDEAKKLLLWSFAHYDW